ncbi:hypothetical protein ACI2UO_18185 [Ralstonia nicotianae]
MQALSIEPSKHPASAQQPGGITVVMARVTPSANTIASVTDSDRTPEIVALQGEANSHCMAMPSPPPTGQPASSELIAPAAVAVLEFAASVAISSAASEIQSYIDSEKAKFTPPTLSLTQNVRNLWDSSSPVPTFTCIVVGQQRAVNASNDPRTKTAPVEWDSVVVLTLIRSDTGVQPVLYKLRPTYFRLARSSALTTIPPSSDGRIDPSKGSGLITTTVGFSLSTTSMAGKSTSVDAKIALSKVKLPPCDSDNVDSCHEPTEWSLDKKMSRAQLIASETPWFALPGPGEPDAAGQPSCKSGMCTPVTVTMSLTQVGNGSPDFDLAKSELSDGTKSLSTAIDKIIEAQAAK